jgi:hypothetical protein
VTSENSTGDSASKAPRTLSWLTRRGGAVREVGNRVDLALSAGLTQSWSSWRSRNRFDAFGASARDALYKHIWTDAATELGAELEELNHEIFEIRRGDRRTRVWRQITEHDDAVTLHMSLDKALMHRQLTALGLKVPEHAVFGIGDLEPALSFLALHPGSDFAVKPAGGTGGGMGVTTGIRSPAQLTRAALRAARFSPDLLIELQPVGDVLRVLFFQGKLIDVLRQRPPSLVGDGRSTIGELIDAENARRLEAEGMLGPSALRVDLDCVFHLENSGRSLADVPGAGERFTVKGVTNENGVDDTTRMHDLSPGIVDQCRKAIEIVGLELIGVDLIAGDPTSDNEGVILEVNGGPGLHHHYLVADGDSKRVAVPILETLLA